MNTHNIYRLYADVRGCGTYMFDAYDEMDYWDEYLAHHFKGEPLPRDWKMPRYMLGDPKKQLNDFVHGEDPAPFVSMRAKVALEEITGGAVQYWPIGEIQGVGYFIMNVVRLLDCLDVKKTQIAYAPDEPAKVLGIDRAVFDAAKIPDDVAIFKVPQYPRPVYVADAFVDCVRRHQLTGVGFEYPHDVGVSAPHNAFPDLPIRK